ncbi:MAG: zinc ribbon domain-containing protein, partial [Planctomycetales bacterium]|nr:zinc ribbon domain-containing protein [Planctomycetales bacterium]
RLFDDADAHDQERIETLPLLRFDCSMTPTHTTKNGSKRYRYYVCMKAQKRGWKNCKSKSVPAAEIEKFVVDKIRHVGHDAALVDEVVEQAKIQSERELGALVAERDELVKELEYWNEAIRVAAPKIKPGSPDVTSLEQLADWHESLRRAEHRHAIVSAKLKVLQAQALTREDVVNALTSFEPIWESLTVREQSRIVQLIVQQVDYDGATGRVTITFHPDGIKTIAMENRPELVEAAS